MIYDKCPWCGKKIERSDIKRVQKAKTPSSLRFARCQHCDNYYGQSLFTKRSAFYWLISLAIFIVICITGFIPLVVCLCLCLWCIIRGPFLKMTKDENVIREEKQLFKGVISKNTKIQKHQYYYLIPNFNLYDAFQMVSPIKIHTYNKRKNEVVFSFLYEHSDNYSHITDNMFLYNYDSSFAFGELKTTHQQTNQRN